MNEKNVFGIGWKEPPLRFRPTYKLKRIKSDKSSWAQTILGQSSSSSSAAVAPVKKASSARGLPLFKLDYDTKRVPSWTDRVLFKISDIITGYSVPPTVRPLRYGVGPFRGHEGKPGQEEADERCSLALQRVSDHLPVVAAFDINTKLIQAVLEEDAEEDAEVDDNTSSKVCVVQ